MEEDDYKELIKQLRKYPECLITAHQAAAAIETLLAEEKAVPVKHGRWLKTAKWWQSGSMWRKCSVCGGFHYKSAFCPSCGAMMDLQDSSTPLDCERGGEIK